MASGGSHWESFGQQHKMAGPAPQFFFAPAQIEKRTRDWGAGEPMRRIGEAFTDYVTFADTWLEIDHATGRDAFAGAWHALVDGDVAPHIGLIRSMNG